MWNFASEHPYLFTMVVLIALLCTENVIVGLLNNRRMEIAFRKKGKGADDE